MDEDVGVEVGDFDDGGDVDFIDNVGGDFDGGVEFIDDTVADSISGEPDDGFDFANIEAGTDSIPDAVCC